MYRPTAWILPPMSSKKARRKQRREQNQEQAGRRSFSPVTIFLIGIGVALLLIVAASVAFSDRSSEGDPPFPGAVWSAAHDHWH